MPTKLSEAQKRVMSFVGKGWTAIPGSGSAVMVNGKRICNVDTMTSLFRMGLVEVDAQRCWDATAKGKELTKEMEL